MKYISTRGQAPILSSSDVVFAGLAEDGGLYMPESYPVFSLQMWRSLEGKSYNDVAFHIMRPYIDDTFSDDELKIMISQAYAGFTQPENIAPLVQIAPNHWVLELFYGPTLAFKDYAMQMLAQIFQGLIAKQHRKLTIIGATSGDTGSAALHACRHIKGAEVFILHPHQRVSEVQRKQMTTVIAPNIHNIALQGTFDDCQAIVKQMFNDKIARENWGLTAVNSINWARILPQVVYYAYSALSLGALDREVSFSVPTGNFGNMFACYVAQKMGLPLGKCIIASNRNNILTRFFYSGKMQVAEVAQSFSPSMDIQVSSNFERMLFEIQCRNETIVKNQMDIFKNSGFFAVEADVIVKLKRLFTAFDVSDSDTVDFISLMEQKTGYVMDPHTAVGGMAAKLWRQQGGGGQIVSLACAHPSKFPEIVQHATGINPEIPEKLLQILQAEEQVEVLPNNFAVVRQFISNFVE
jgi:threonine synthase